MQTLNEKTWREFFLNELFSIGAGKRLETRNKVNGKRPFVGASENNNGVTGFVGNTNASLDKNVLGISYNGAPCIAFYHPYECLFTDDVKRLHLIERNDSIAYDLFFPAIFSMQRAKYNYGYKFKEQRMKRQKLMLPVNAENEPDYDYMEQYTSSMRGGLLMRYRNYAKARLEELNYIDVPSLNEKEWQPVSISSIFTLVRGREGNMAKMEPGAIPLISAKAVGNGLKGFVANPKKVVPGDCITLNNDGDGGAGLAYYQPANMALDTHVTALQPKIPMSKWTMLFISRCLSGLHGFFGHGLSISNPRAERIRVMLPVNAEGGPDFEYMEQYTKNMMLKKYEQYFEYLDR